MGGLKDHALISRMVTNALPIGMTRVSQSRFEWDVSGRCEAPVSVEMEGRPASDWIRRLKFVVVAKRKKHPLIVVLHTPCRKCRSCMRARMKIWTARAMHEVREAHRTWFATFTLRPEKHYEMQCRAVAIADARSIPTNELTSDDLSARQSTEVEKELTLFLKRVRKEVPSTGVRYLLVREKHKSGLPHWHALIHEVGEVPITHAMLSRHWQLGFAKFKLIQDERAAFYVAKYLGKSNEGRVRASIRYGRWTRPTNDLGHSAEELRRVCSEARRERSEPGNEKTSQKKETQEQNELS